LVNLFYNVYFYVLKNKLRLSYIHGTHEEEQSRLYILNRLLNQRCLDKIEIVGDELGLDIGSGLGVFSRMLAKKLLLGRMIGVERSPDQLNKARHLAREDHQDNLVEFREGSAYELPLKNNEWGTFDLVFIRFLLEHLAQPEIALQQAKKAMKPGAKIMLVDDDHANFRITPHTPAFEHLWTLYCRVYDKLGNDPYIGRNLVTLLHQTGFRNFKIDFILFGATAAEADFKHYANNLIGILEGAKAEIIQIGEVSEELFMTYIQELEAWSQKEDATLWYAANWAEAVL